MANYWVALPPAGDDTHVGSEASPWATPAHAVSIAAAGDTVTFKDGAYDVGTGVDLARSGANGSPITFQADNSRDAIWATSGAGIPLSLEGFDWIDLDGLVFQGLVTETTASIVRTDGSTDVNFTDCELRNSQGRGFWLRACSRISIIDCEIHPETNNVTGQILDGLQADNGCVDILVDGTEVYHTPHVGLTFREVAGGIIRDCYIHDTSSHGIQLSHAENTGIVIEDNLIAETGSWRATPSSKMGIIIVMADDVNDVNIRRNDIHSCDGPGIGIWSSAVGPLTIYNNTLYNNEASGEADWGELFLKADIPDNDPVINFRNNIVYHTLATRTYLREAGFTNVTIDYNLLYDSTGTEDIRVGGITYGTYAAYQVAGYEPNSIVSQNPNFVNPGVDFNLLVTSPAINAGVDVGLPYVGAAPDIGAHEFVGGMTTSSSTSTSTTSTSTTTTSTSTTSTSSSTTILTTSTSTTTTSTSSSTTSSTSTSISTSTTSTSTTSTSTTSTSTTSTSSSTTSTSTTTTSTSTTSTSSSTSTTLPPLLPTCPGTEKDQILVPISGGYKAYSVMMLLGIGRRTLRSTANFGNAPMHFITQRGPFQDGETAIDMRWDPRVMQLMVSEALHNRWDFWERRHSILDKLSPYRNFNPADDAPRFHIYRKWLPDGGFIRGSDGVTTANSAYVTTSTGRFIEYGLEAGQRFDLTNGDDEAGYIVASVPNDYTVELSTHMLNTATGVGWIYRRGWGKRDLYCSLEQGPTFDEGPGASPEYPTGYHEVLRFIAHDPFWYGQEQQETYAAPTIIEALIFGGGGAWFDAAGQWLFADGYVEESNTVVYWGNVPAKPTIEITGPANRPLITNETSDMQLQLNASISEGTTVTIDTLELTAEDGDGVSWDQYLEGDLVSFAIEPPPQAPNRENTITVSFSNAKYAVSAAVIKWRNRYSGI